MRKINFRELLGKLSRDDVIDILQLDLSLGGKEGKEKLRGSCPACEGEEGRSLVINPKNNIFNCYAQFGDDWGDFISLTAHVKDFRTTGGDLDLRRAALYLAEQAGFFAKDTSVQNPEASTPEPHEPVKEPDTPEPIKEPGIPATTKEPEIPAGFPPLKNLDYDHESIELTDAATLGVGWCKRGLMRGRIVFPLYREGTLVGYAGYSPKDGDIKYPTNLLKEDVVPIRKQA